MDFKVLIGLVGFRCCGKSTLRSILNKQGYPVFDTNSVRTGDSDANQISLDEILQRYGKNKSYLFFIERPLRDFVQQNQGIIFIDSLKVSSDLDIMRQMFADSPVELWYLHASNKTRLTRYIQRDVNTNIRSQELEEHDEALERHGILDLIKSSSEAINMELGLDQIEKQVEMAITRFRKRYPNLINHIH